MEEFIHLRPFFDLLLPGTSLKSLDSFQDILEIVKSKYPRTFVYNKQRKVVHLHIDFGRESNLSLAIL